MPLALIGSALVAAGCGARFQTAGSAMSKSGPDAVVIQKAASQISDTHTAAPAPFPRADNSVAPCKIGVGGAPRNRTIAGTCSTAVRTDGPDKVITFTETWNAQSFRGAGSPSHGLLISVWQITLDQHGKVIHQTHTGDFPPQSAT